MVNVLPLLGRPTLLQGMFYPIMYRAKELMLMLGLNETIDCLAMANSVHWYVLC